jgi:hypothetical protein
MDRVHVSWRAQHCSHLPFPVVLAKILLTLCILFFLGFTESWNFSHSHHCMFCWPCSQCICIVKPTWCTFYSVYWELRASICFEWYTRWCSGWDAALQTGRSRDRGSTHNLKPANIWKCTQLTPKTASVVPPEDGRLTPEHVKDYDTIKCLWKWKCIKSVTLLW